MIHSFATLTAALTLAASAAFAQFPPVPDHTFDGMPPEIARQLRHDLDRVQGELHRMMTGQPLPLFNGAMIPPLTNGAYRHCEQSQFSCVNGAFQLRHHVNGTGYRISGTMRGGPLCVQRVWIDQNGRCFEYAGLDEVPATHRATIRNLLQPYERFEE